MHRVVKAVRDFLGCRIGEPGVVAVSGGADSVALLRALLEAGCENLTVAHVNHQLRANESDSDEAFVQNLAESLGLVCRATRIEVANEPGNLESNARRVRYDFLDDVAGDVGATWIATGHTADDQAETVLHRLIRGTGLQGLRGIASERSPPKALGGLAVIRPLLTVTRAEIVDYLDSLNQAFRTDSSNADPRFTRNRIRAELVPLLKTFNPEVVTLLGRLAEQADEAFTFLEQHAQEFLRRFEKPRAGEMVVLDRAGLVAAPRVLLREMLRMIWQREGWPMGQMGFEDWERAANLTGGNFPGGVVMHIRERVVQLFRSSKFQVPSSK